MSRAAPRIPRSVPVGKRRPNERLRPKHRAWIGTLPCIKCGRHPCDAAHVRIGTDGGTSLKPSDRFTVPLCRDCHRSQHEGEVSFWAELGIDPVDVSARLWAVTGDDEQGARAIERAHQAIRLRRLTMSDRMQGGENG